MSEHDSGGTGGTRQRLLRWAGGAALVFGIGVVVLIVTVRSALDTQVLEGRLNDAVVEASDGAYRVQVDTVQWGFWARSLRLEGIRLHAHRPAAPRDVGEQPAPGRLQLSVPTLQLEGIDPWALVWNQTLRLDAVHLRRPRLTMDPTADPPPDSKPNGGASTDTSGASGTLRDVTVEQLQVHDGTLVRGPTSARPTDSLWGVSLHLRRLSLDTARTKAARSYLIRQFVEGRMDGYRRQVPGDPYRLQMENGHLSGADSTLRLTNLRFGPTVPDETFVRHYEYRVNRYRTSAAEVSGAGIDLRRFLEEGALCAARLRIDDLTLDVYRNNQRPEDPNDPPPPMPQDLVDDLERRLCIDTLRLRDSRIRYVKRPEDSPRTGRIAFDDLYVSGYNLTTDPQRMSPSMPAVFEVRTRVNGAGLLRASFHIPLLAPHLTLSFRGHLGPMDPRALNDPFVPLGGVRIEQGQVDSLWFRADVERGTATGSVGAVYRNLEVETVDEATGARGVGERLKTTVAGVALRNDNLPSDEVFHRGQIKHTREPQDSFFKFLWHAVRDGIYSLVGIDRLPR